jgi:hypothetical protein
MTTGTCFDCGGAIAFVNHDTAAKDGWSRYECQGCHRHLAFTQPRPAVSAAVLATVPALTPVKEKTP